MATTRLTDETIAAATKRTQDALDTLQRLTMSRRVLTMLDHYNAGPLVSVEVTLRDDDAQYPAYYDLAITGPSYPEDLDDRMDATDEGSEALVECRNEVSALLRHAFSFDGCTPEEREQGSCEFTRADLEAQIAKDEAKIAPPTTGESLGALRRKAEQTAKTATLVGMARDLREVFEGHPSLQSAQFHWEDDEWTREQYVDFSCEMLDEDSDLVETHHARAEDSEMVDLWGTFWDTWSHDLPVLMDALPEGKKVTREVLDGLIPEATANLVKFTSAMRVDPDEWASGDEAEVAPSLVARSGAASQVDDVALTNEVVEAVRGKGTDAAAAATRLLVCRDLCALFEENSNLRSVVLTPKEGAEGGVPYADMECEVAGYGRSAFMFAHHSSRFHSVWDRWSESLPALASALPSSAKGKAKVTREVLDGLIEADEAFLAPLAAALGGAVRS